MNETIQKLRDGLAGRSGRQEYWVRTVIIGMANLVLQFGFGVFGLPALLWVVGLAAMLVWLYVAARRLHDLGLTGLLGLLPFFGGILVLQLVPRLSIPSETATALTTFGPVALSIAIGLWLGCAPGQRHTNRYGPPPGQEGPAEAF